MSNSDKSVIEWQKQTIANRDTRIQELESAIEGNTPAGWQLVPIEPTDDMLHEMRDTTLDYELDDLDERRMSKSLFNAVYKAMLKAAPKPEDG